MKKTMGTLSTIAVLTLSPLAVSGPAHADAHDGSSAKAPHYPNCTALNRVYKHGVARSKAAAQLQVRQGNGLPNYGPRGRAVYRANSGPLDRDNDGTACER